MNSPPLSPELLAAAPGIAARLTAILAALAALVAHAFLRDPRRVAMINPLWAYITRTGRRFARLMNRLPVTTRARAPRPGPSTGKPPVRFPTKQTWLVVALSHHGAGQANYLQRLLNEPETTALLAQLPQAGRILRPLCHMLGVTHPALALPRRSRSKPPSTAFAGLGREADQGRGPSRSDGKGERRADAPSRPDARSRPIAPSVFLPLPKPEICPRLLTRWPWVPHPNARPKPT